MSRPPRAVRSVWRLTVEGLVKKLAMVEARTEVKVAPAPSCFDSFLLCDIVLSLLALFYVSTDLSQAHRGTYDEKGSLGAAASITPPLHSSHGQAMTGSRSSRAPVSTCVHARLCVRNNVHIGRQRVRDSKEMGGEVRARLGSCARMRSYCVQT